MTVTLTRLDGQKFRPPLFEEARCCDAPHHTSKGLAHPYGIANVAWARVELSLQLLLDAFDSTQKNGSQHIFGAPQLLEAHRNFIYSVAEFNEAIVEKALSCLVPPSTKIPNAEGSRKLRRHADIICNKLKHEQNRLQFVEAKCPLWSVLGYSVVGYSKDQAIAPNSLIHTDRHAFSFAADIRMLTARMYALGSAVGRVLSRYRAANPPPPIPGQQEEDAKVLTLLQRVMSLPQATFPWESSKHMPKLSYDGETFSIRDHGGEVTRFVGEYIVTAHCALDGATNKLRVF